jgi:hypothetical protein
LLLQKAARGGRRRTGSEQAAPWESGNHSIHEAIFAATEKMTIGDISLQKSHQSLCN